MPPTTGTRSAILIITALILIQGAPALTIEQAPLNPAFVAYTEGLDSGDIDQYSIECCRDSCPADTTAPHAMGLLPSPAVVVWPDGYASETVNEDFPTVFDLREAGRVTPVRDQGDCGSCWAFASYGSLESTYLTDTGNAENFSEKNMNNLCSNLYLFDGGFDYAPCRGGWATMSTAYLTRGSGPVQEADDPYALPKPSIISPTNLSPVLDVRDVTFLPPREGPRDNNHFKQTLRDEGAIWVEFYVNWSCFADNRTTYYWPGDEEEYAIDGGHAVTLVGWDDAYPKENFTVEAPGDGAFILKNSWGTSSGDNGYFYISYYDPILGHFYDMETTHPYDLKFYNTPGALYTGVPADPDKHIYQYDPLGWTESIGTGEDTTFYGANVFTAENYEELTDVSFYTREPETEYTIAIFTNFTTPPGDAAPVTWMSGTCALPGYHTISLPDAVPLRPGDVFSVVLEVSSPTDPYPLVVEMPIRGYSSGALACPGESFVSDDGETWEDLTISSPDTNVCIKAHTHTFTVVPEDYPTIQEAIDASEAGDTIVVVNEGMYTEELVIDKPLTLRGERGVVVATPEDGTGVVIEADNVTIAGFMFDGDGSTRAQFGMKVEEDNCTIRDCQVTGYAYGLWLPSVKGLSLSDTSSYDNDYNLMYENPDNDPGNAIAETVMVNGRPVIYREGVSGETIDASSDAGAVIFENCTDMTIRDTTTDAIGYGYYLCGCEDLSLENVSADAVDFGLGLLFSENVTIRDSTFGPDATDGMLLLSNDGLLVDGNEITTNEEGIFFLAMDDVTIRDNDISTSGCGIFGFECINGSILGNNITGNPAKGIYAMLGQHISIQNNTVDASDYGIYTYYLLDSQISGNTIECNNTGIGFKALLDSTQISGNTVENCSASAIMELNDSVVYANHFSGGVYPDIIAPEWGGDVYVYRNDFVLTDGPVFGSILSASAAADAMPESADITTVIRDHCLSPDGTLPEELSQTGEFRGIIMEADTAFAAQQTNAVDVVWNTPTEETYWYRGQPFTRTPGNYWSTYNGTDTTGDGIGDTPFVYLNETRDSYPLTQPIGYYADENPDAGGDDPTDDMATTGAMQAGDTATFSFTGTAVEEVKITAADGTGQVVLTIDSRGSGPDGLEGSVYQYLTAELFGMTDADVSEAVFSFRVPAAWMKAEGLKPADMTLFRYHNGTWQELPTSIIREEGGWVHFEATTPGFSTFAIAKGSGLNAMIDAIPEINGPGPEIINETAGDAVSSGTLPAGETVPEPQVTVAIPEVESTGTPTETATTTQESPLGAIPLITGAAGAALLFRRH